MIFIEFYIKNNAKYRYIKQVFVILILCVLTSSSYSQHRINTYNQIGWYNYFGTFNFCKKLGTHTEYQWRRNNIATDWQQSLLRVGINYNFNPRVLFRVGYGWIETFPYGQYPINNFGKDFTEHRIFQVIQLSHNEQMVSFLHRFMVEQRFIGKYTSPELTQEDEFSLLHRIRYMIRTQLPLKKYSITDKMLYLATYDEVFIGFGKNVAMNVFDQNRIGVLLGYTLTKNIKIETGYLNQTLQYSRTINGKSTFQNNNGVILNANFTFDSHKN